MTAAGEASHVGRPRDPRVDRSILEQTLRLLREQGYQQMSIEGVAAAAGVGKPAIYRRYPSKAALVTAALAGLRTDAQAEDPPDDTRAALAHFTRQTAMALANAGAMTVLGTLIAQEKLDPELAQTLRARLFLPAIARVREVLERGIARRELRPDVDPQPVIDMLFGALLARAALGEPATGEWLRAVDETIWSGIAA